MSELVPPHVITNIFSRLPVKSVLRFRCVSKPICALIDSPHFINSHLQKSLTSNTNTTIVTASVDCTQLYSLHFDLCNTSPTFINHPFLHCGAHFLASCNGLFLLLTAKSLDTCVSETVVQPDPPNIDLVLVNPATRNYKLLLVSPIEYPTCYSKTKCELVIYALGYDSVHDDYKVVRIVQFPGMVKNEVKIFSLKMNSWRRVKDFPYRLCGTSHGVFLDGALHWFVTKRSGGNFAIIATFDLETEKYGSLPQPHYSDTSSCMLSLGVLGGKLCVNRNYNMRYIDLWVMEKYGEKKSWIKILSVAPNVDNQFVQLKPLAYSNNGKKVLLLKDAGQLIWYDLELKVINKIRNPAIPPEFWRAYVSMESLVKLSCDASTAFPRIQRKKKKSKLDDFLSKAFNPVLWSTGKDIGTSAGR